MSAIEDFIEMTAGTPAPPARAAMATPTPPTPPAFTQPLPGPSHASQAPGVPWQTSSNPVDEAMQEVGQQLEAGMSPLPPMQQPVGLQSAQGSVPFSYSYPAAAMPPAAPSNSYRAPAPPVNATQAAYPPPSPQSQQPYGAGLGQANAWVGGLPPMPPVPNQPLPQPQSPGLPAVPAMPSPPATQASPVSQPAPASQPSQPAQVAMPSDVREIVDIDTMIQREVTSIKFETGLAVLEGGEGDWGRPVHVVLGLLKFNCGMGTQEKPGLMGQTRQQLLEFEAALTAHQVFVQSLENWWKMRHLVLGRAVADLKQNRRGQFNGETVKEKEYLALTADPHAKKVYHDFLLAQAVSQLLEGMGNRFSQLEDGLKRAIDFKAFEDEHNRRQHRFQ